MKLLLLSVSTLLFSLSGAIAQSLPCACAFHPTSKNALLVGSFTLVVPINSGGTTTDFRHSDCQSHSEVCVWLMSNGNLDLVINSKKMTFTGDCSTIKSTSFSTILDLVAPLTIEHGIVLGHLSCSSLTDTIRVLSTLCTQNGSTNNTSFDACDTIWGQRLYKVVCSQGTLSITELPGTAIDCSTTHQNRCEESSGTNAHRECSLTNGKRL